MDDGIRNKEEGIRRKKSQLTILYTTRMKRHLLWSLMVLISIIMGASRAHAQAQWNTNLLQNTVPTAESQYTGWEKTNGGSGWGIENGYFVSSNEECILKQTVTLADYGFTADDLSGQSLYASVRYWIPWPGNGQGMCIAAVVCLDGNGAALDTLYLLNMTGYRNVEIASTVKDSLFTLPAGTAQLRYEVHGEDQKGWRGQYGPKFTDMVMMVLKRDLTYTASVDPAMGDSITLSKTSGIHTGDTIEVSATYPEYPIKKLVVEGEKHRIEGNKVICGDGNMVIGAQLLHPHAITPNTPYATITPSQTTAYVGDTITLSHTMNAGYVFTRYTTSSDVQWLDPNRFIMPDEAVEIGMETIALHTIPFFEGFEEGNTEDEAVSGWAQYSEGGSREWRANQGSAYNTSPYQGAWNAILRWGNTDWLFRWVYLEAGKTYRLAMYARQDESNTDYANMSAYIGNAQNKDSMRTVIIPETGLTNGDYQLLAGTFSVADSNIFALGIRGRNGQPLLHNG